MRLFIGWEIANLGLVLPSGNHYHWICDCPIW